MIKSDSKAPPARFFSRLGRDARTAIEKKIITLIPEKSFSMPIPDERESSVREFNELYFTYRSNFISIARSYVEETAVAEDIVTDSFVAYWVRRHELAADTDPRRYVVGAIKKRCLEHLRNKQIHQRVEKKLQDASDRMLEYHLGSLECCKPEQLYADEVLDILQKRLDEMPELTREIFIASRTEELSYKDIAERYRIPSYKVKYELQKALTQLRDSLKDYLPGFLILITVDFLLRHSGYHPTGI